MKRIIALALTILLGSTGYVIVDHTIEDRVGVLESQVESLNGVVSSLEDKHTLKYNPVLTTYNTTVKKYSVGEKIETAKTQKMQFNIRYVKYRHADYGYECEEYYDNEYNTYYWFSDVIVEKDYKVNLTDLSFIVESTNTVEYSQKEQYTTSIKYGDQVKIKVILTGNTSPELAGKNINFDLIYDKTSNFKPTTQRPISGESVNNDTGMIGSDGSFSFERIYTYTNYSGGMFTECYLVNPQIS
ncbi:MAG: hypothetical protein IJZ88_05835 [Clostridia bacterium]|nr:hypothetical protein [Clostridia bacterium]